MQTLFIAPPNAGRLTGKPKARLSTAVHNYSAYVAFHLHVVRCHSSALSAFSSLRYATKTTARCGATSCHQHTPPLSLTADWMYRDDHRSVVSPAITGGPNRDSFHGLPRTPVATSAINHTKPWTTTDKSVIIRAPARLHVTRQTAIE